MSAEIKKTFAVALDVKRPVSNRDFEVVADDTGNVLRVSLSDGGSPVALTGCRVVAVFSNSAGTASQDNQREDGGITVTGDDSNVAEIALFPSSVAPGSVECELQVYSGDAQDVLVTSAKFNFRCRRPMLNSGTIEATNEHPLLIALIQEVNEAVTRTQHDASDIISGALPVERGGTGVATAAAAREALGAAALAHASQHASGGEDAVTPAAIGAAASAHTHGAGDIASGALSIERGGTGADSAAGARAALGITPANIGAAAADSPVITGTASLNAVVVLDSNSYGTTLPAAGTAGRLFFKKVT